ncbi:MAG: ferritin family protein [Candidatus Hydrogenedentes bacterium]|nr:ferritin family protein [Candidatus Hydrogenedentota bacterium]
MSLFFNPREVLEMAVQIERNGKRFYREAANTVKEERLRGELGLLSVMEEGHEAMFQALLQQLSVDALGAEWDDPEGEAAQYLQTFSNGPVFDLERSVPPELVGANANLDGILEWAIGREGDSILFYTGLKGLIPSAGDKAKIDTIINEEMGHVALLNRRLREVAGK